MDIILKLKFLAGILFYGIFAYQMKNALTTYIQKPTTTVSKLVDFEELEYRPQITICKAKQFNDSKAHELGYRELDYLLAGVTDDTKGNVVSWGKHVNKTFQEVLDHVYGEAIDAANVVDDYNKTLRKREVFIANKGKCFVYDEYQTPYVTITFHTYDIREDDDEFEIYVTDPQSATEYNIGEVFTTGEKIKVDKSSLGLFNAYLISMKSNMQIFLCSKSKDVRIDCLESKAKERLKNYIGDCLPPWITNGAQCDSVYKKSETIEYVNKFRFEDIYNVVIGLQLYKDMCENVCQKMELNVIQTQKIVKEDKNTARIDLIFDKHIQVVSQQYSYNVFNLLVEVGSALGLWIGYSAMGLTDILFIITSRVYQFCTRGKPK